MPSHSVAVQEDAERTSSLDVAIRSLLRPVTDALQRIDARLDERRDDPSPDRHEPARVEARTMRMAGEPPQTLGAAVAVWNHSLDGVERGIAELRDQLGSLIAAAAARSAASRDATAARSLPGVTPSPPGTADGQVWERILFGEEITAAPSLASARRALVDDVVVGSAQATALAGQLLLVRAASVDELPELFHRVGEAYYRWRPRIDDRDEPLERALAQWLSKRAETFGLRNTIELVRFGDRFDAARHLSDSRGAEVIAVHGWIVMRDNQKIYTKAGVSLK